SKISDDLLLMEKILEFDIDCNVADNNGWSPLHVAIKNRIPSNVKILLSKDANINCKTKSGWSTLMLAVKQCTQNSGSRRNLFEESKKIIEVLLSFPGIEVDCCDDFGWTPLKVAVESNNLEIAKMLIK